jgi:hypothetical protein
MNRRDRRAAGKKDSSLARPVSKPSEKAPIVDTMENDLGPFFNVTVKDAENNQSVYNLSLDALLERIAVPFRLRKPFRVEGFEFHPARIKSLLIRKTTSRYNPGAGLKKIDTTSISSAFSSIMAAASDDQLNKGEEVTDDILKQADQYIEAHNLKPAKAGAFESDIRPNKAFIVMAFSEDLAESFDAISRACTDCGIQAVRADQEKSSAPIMDRVLQHLKDANFVIADLTNARPNVYYEVGYFDAICDARHVDAADHLLLVARNLDTDVHFDVRHRGIQIYPSAYGLLNIVTDWFKGHGVRAKTK